MADDKIVVGIEIDNRDANKKLKETDQRAKNMQKSFSSLKLAGVAALAGIGVGLNGVIKAAARFETINTKFEVLTGSVGEAQKALKQLQAFSAKTPFQFEDVAKAGQTLLAFGFGTGELTTRLQQLGDVSAATGKNIGEIAIIFGQVNAAGKLTGERFNQLAEAGVNVGPAIAKTLGVAESQVRELITAGEVTFEVFDKAFKSLSQEGGIAFGAIEKQSKTFSGAISTLKDNFTLLQVSLGQRLLPILRLLATSTTNFIAKLSEGKGIVDGFVSVLKGVVSVGAVVRRTILIIGETIGAVFGTAFGAISQALEGNFKQAFETIKSGAIGAANAAKENAMGVFDDLKLIEEQFAVDEDALRTERNEVALAKQAEFEGKMTELSKKEKEQRLKDEKTFYTTLASLQSANSKVFVAIGKAAAIAQIAIDTEKAASASYAYGATIGGPILGNIFSALAYTAQGVKAANIAGIKLAKGGFAEFQRGGSISGGLASADSVPALLTRGEFVAPNTGTNSANAVIDARAREIATEEAGGQAIDVNINFNQEEFGRFLDVTVTERRALGISAV